MSRSDKRGPSPARGKGDHEVVDEGNLYHSFNGIIYQFYVMQICSISRAIRESPLRKPLSFNIKLSLLGASRTPRPTTAAVYIYGIGIREPSPFGEGGGEADG